MPNALSGSNSPYLLQHADNPVDWWEWGPDALEEAARLDRPILLSVGYSACHWCHVMAHESFENDEIAEVMNGNFVNVKVDREERPDIDAVYMDAVQAMTGHGGWPLTAFLTPVGEPFYGGTYFPPTSRHGMVGFKELLEGIAEAWNGRRDEVQASANKLVEALRTSGAGPAPITLNISALDTAAAEILTTADRSHGGFGTSPKFPSSANLRFLLDRGIQTGEQDKLDVVNAALDGMAGGGIHDHLGGGFHRYSVDASWTVPHFEKMLYDNAQLFGLFVAAWAVTGNQRHLDVAGDIAAWASSEMTGEHGAFYATQDADTSEGEGAFFSWTQAELDSVLGPELGALAAEWFDVTPAGTFEHGRSVLASRQNSEAFASARGLTPDALERDLEIIRSRLLEARNLREKPGTDTKVITEWNGLMIDALARGAAMTGRADWLSAALRAAEFVLGPMRRSDGELVHSWREGRVGAPAFLEDYMAMANATISLWHATFDPAWLKTAEELILSALEQFGALEGLLDRSGPFHEALIAQRKDIIDGSTPSGNAQAAEALWRLGALIHEPALGERSMQIVEHALGIAETSPLAVGASLSVAAALAGGVREIAVLSEGGPGDAMLKAARSVPMPGVVIAWASKPQPSHPVPWLAGRPMPGGEAVAYVCSGMTCGAPIREAGALREVLGSA